jgi:hypothetical protein
MHAQLPPVWPYFTVNIDEFPTWTDPHHARTLPLDHVESGHVQHDSTLQWYRLPIIAGAPTTCCDWNPMSKTRGGNPNNISFMPRPDHGLRAVWSQLSVQHWTVPKEVPRFLPNQSRFRDYRHIGQFIQQTIERFHMILLGPSQAYRMPT